MNWTEEEMEEKYKGMTRNVTKNEKLTELDKAILLTIYTRGGKSKKAHFPVEFICRGFPSHLHGKIKKRVEKLKRKGYIFSKLNPSGMSYGLSEKGWEVARELEKELERMYL
ncbi:MAG: hypothetical protein OCU24_01880 [Candidatus Methanospirare jalkutatii]|nr:hypothetical protein [Candidatus Methanospirare jalkutatii]